MSTQMQAKDKNQIIEQVMISGNLAGLNPQQRVEYYNAVCESIGLNPLTRPFDYITLNGKLTLYARKDAADQLRKINNVSITIKEQKEMDGIYVVTAHAKDKNGKEDEDAGAVPIAGLKGDAKANAILKCITKAKRRVTLSICGLGFLDETEVESIPGAQRFTETAMAEKSQEKLEQMKAAEAPASVNKTEPAPKAEPAPVPAKKTAAKPKKAKEPEPVDVESEPVPPQPEYVQDEVPPPSDDDFWNPPKEEKISKQKEGKKSWAEHIMDFHKRLYNAKDMEEVATISMDVVSAKKDGRIPVEDIPKQELIDAMKTLDRARQDRKREIVQTQKDAKIEARAMAEA